ncbi:uncharacterized protein LOC119599105 [Penaeus monodon]|uniref:uncharacterized protein LOC119599105 n=1 Tax=Penaeus monodon TaxID=6687 RepID=UPI0018A72664|nr:uncharacterized protein LOC119599105 [Penaeus monodon]
MFPLIDFCVYHLITIFIPTHRYFFLTLLHFILFLIIILLILIIILSHFYCYYNFLSRPRRPQHIERLTSQVTSLGEQSRRQSELYETAVKRGRQCEAEVHALTTRGRQLEADAQTAEASREHVVIEKEKTERILNRVIEALGLTEMGQEVTNDVEMIICRCQQLAKLEGEKIVDKVRRA